MKSEWREGTIGEVCVTVTDGSHISPKSVDKGHYMVSVKDFTPFGFDFMNCRQISDGDYSLLKKNGCVPQINDILVGKDGVRYFEDIILYRQPEKPALLSSIAIIRCNKQIILPKFLYYILKSPDFKKDVRDNYGSGSAIPRIILKDFKRMPIRYPNISIQRSISDTLSCLDDKIELNNRINKNLEAQAQAIFKSWFVDFEPFQDGEFVDSELGKIPKGWKVSRLDKIANFTNGLAMQKYRPKENEISFPVLKIKELRQGKTDASSELCSANISEEYIVEDGDVVFSWSGSLMVDIWCSGKVGLNQHLFKVTSNEFNKWFYYYWTCYHLNEFQAIAESKATTMGHIKRTHLSNALVIIPTKDDYIKIDMIMSPFLESIINNKKQNQALSTLRDTLLPKLMSGEIQIPQEV